MLLWFDEKESTGWLRGFMRERKAVMLENAHETLRREVQEGEMEIEIKENGEEKEETVGNVADRTLEVKTEEIKVNDDYVPRNEEVEVIENQIRVDPVENLNPIFEISEEEEGENSEVEINPSVENYTESTEDENDSHTSPEVSAWKLKYKSIQSRAIRQLRKDLKERRLVRDVSNKRHVPSAIKLRNKAYCTIFRKVMHIPPSCSLMYNNMNFQKIPYRRIIKNALDDIERADPKTESLEKHPINWRILHLYADICLAPYIVLFRPSRPADKRLTWDEMESLIGRTKVPKNSTSDNENISVGMGFDEQHV